MPESPLSLLVLPPKQALMHRPCKFLGLDLFLDALVLLRTVKSVPTDPASLLTPYLMIETCSDKGCREACVSRACQLLS